MEEAVKLDKDDIIALKDAMQSNEIASLRLAVSNRDYADLVRQVLEKHGKSGRTHVIDLNKAEIVERAPEAPPVS